jgi:hypothetical protein
MCDLEERKVGHQIGVVWRQRQRRFVYLLLKT